MLSILKTENKETKINMLVKKISKEQYNSIEKKHLLSMYLRRVSMA